MFVLDALRQLRSGKLTIPSFHLGHLGFRPELEVESQYFDILSDTGEMTGHELTLTPFQGHRKDLFLFKCIFKEQPGVVARALSAFTQLGLNILSLESATIDRDSKHVLFCILSWASSKHTEAIPLEESIKYKFVDALPLLPTFDQRYVFLLERFLACCFDAIEYEHIPGGRLHLPRISIKPFDDFYSPQRIRPLKVFREVPDQEYRLPAVKVDLINGGARRAPSEDAFALLFSETETKALHVIFPQSGREENFLHIGFTHANKPGALLVIARLLQYCGFSIKTSLLRLHEQPDSNVWEMTVERVEGSTEPIPAGKRGVEWFRDWCFNPENPQAKDILKLAPGVRSYNIQVCRPTYPRRYDDRDDEFAVIDLVPETISTKHEWYKGDHLFLRGLAQMEAAMAGNEKGSWLAKLIYPNLMNRVNFIKGQVFLSIPSYCELHTNEIKTRFNNELKLDVVTYTRADASPLVSTEALNMIRDADYYFGVWHHEKNKPGDLSPWLPFEFGAAKAMGKRFQLIAHQTIPDELTLRIDRNYSLIKFDDVSFGEAVTKVITACRRRWELE